MRDSYISKIKFSFEKNLKSTFTFFFVKCIIYLFNMKSRSKEVLILLKNMKSRSKEVLILFSNFRYSESLKPLETNWQRRFRREHCPGKPSRSPLPSQTPSSAITPPTQRCKKITFSHFMTLLIKLLAYLPDDPVTSICSVSSKV